MGSVAEKYAHLSVITEDNSRDEDTDMIIGQIISGFISKDSAIAIPDRCAAISYAIMHARDNDIIAILGKGRESYIIDKNGTRDYDEYAVIKRALKDRNNSQR
jgi:UDP-N-acetylmuramoyl-L-alanyl-D-glutamate--2,6-diaminopimelate ligase